MVFDSERTPKTTNDYESVTLAEGGAMYDIDKRDKTLTHWTDADSYRIAEMHPVDDLGTTVEFVA